jgi:hypothetical protein
MPLGPAGVRGELGWGQKFTIMSGAVGFGMLDPHPALSSAAGITHERTALGRAGVDGRPFLRAAAGGSSAGDTQAGAERRWAGRDDGPDDVEAAAGGLRRGRLGQRAVALSRRARRSDRVEAAVAAEHRGGWACQLTAQQHRRHPRRPVGCLRGISGRTLVSHYQRG